MSERRAQRAGVRAALHAVRVGSLAPLGARAQSATLVMAEAARGHDCEQHGGAAFAIVVALVFAAVAFGVVELWRRRDRD